MVFEETAAAKKQKVLTQKRWVEDRHSTLLKTEKQFSSLPVSFPLSLQQQHWKDKYPTNKFTEADVTMIL